MSKFLAMLSLSILVALTCTAAVAEDCSIEIKSTTKKYVFITGSAYFDVLAEKTKVADVKLTVHSRAMTNGRAYTKDDKRVRFVMGVPIAIENIKKREGGHTDLGFYAEDKSFVGKLSTAKENANHASGFVLRVSNVSGKASNVLLKYDAPRPRSDALKDAVCIYRALPEMMKEVRN